MQVFFYIFFIFSLLPSYISGGGIYMNHLWKYIEKKDMPYIIAVAVLGALNHFLYELSGGATFLSLSLCEHLAIYKFQPQIWDYQLLLSQAPCRIVRHGFCYYAFLYLYRSSWAPFSDYGYPDLLIWHTVLLLCGIYMFQEKTSQALPDYRILILDHPFPLLFRLYLLSTEHSSFLSPAIK